MTATHEIKTTLDATTITTDGVEITDYSEALLTLSQYCDGTLPSDLAPRIAVDFGGQEWHTRRIMADVPSEIWHAAIDGSLTF